MFNSSAAGIPIYELGSLFRLCRHAEYFYIFEYASWTQLYFVQHFVFSFVNSIFLALFYAISSLLTCFYKMKVIARYAISNQ